MSKNRYGAKDSRFGGWRLGGAILVLLTAPLLVQCSDGPAAETAPSAPHVLNQPIQVEGIEVVVTSVEERSSVGSDFLRESAADGGILIVVNYTLKNVSSEPKGIMPSVRLRDANGATFDPDFGKVAAYAGEADLNAKALSDLNPGITVRDADVFEVSKEAFDRATWSVLIDEKPVRIEGLPPSNNSGRDASAIKSAPQAGVVPSTNDTTPLPPEDKEFRSVAFGRCMDASQGANYAMRACSEAEAARQDKELNRVYKQAMEEAEPEEKERLRNIQRKWIAARDAKCTSAYEDHAPSYDAGLMWDNCWLAETQERIVFLREMWLHQNRLRHPYLNRRKVDHHDRQQKGKS